MTSLVLARNFVLPASVAAVDLSRSPAFGWRNHYLNGTVTASSAQADHPPQLAFDGFTSTAWRTVSGSTHWIEVALSEAKEADYFAIAAHTLSGTEVTPQYHDGAAWQDAATGVNLPSNGPAVWTFDAVTAARWRLLIEGAPDEIALGAVHVGKAMRPDSGLPIGWQPPSLNEDVEYAAPVSVGGQLLPRQIRRRGVEVQVRLSALEYGFGRGDWLDFIEFGHGRAFFFWWVFAGQAEVIYGGLEDHGGRFARATTIDTNVSIRGINR